MQRHTLNYFKFFKIDYSPDGWHEYIPCEVCHKKSDDLHHIESRIKGVKRLDQVENIIALCRDCHNKAHAGTLTKEQLKRIHKIKMKYYD